MPYTLSSNLFIDDTVGSQNGALLRVRAIGFYNTTGAPTITLSMYIAGVMVATSGPMTAISNASSKTWVLDVDVWANSPGTCIGAPRATLTGPLSVEAGLQANTGLSAGGALTFSAKFSAASVSNNITISAFTVELLKAQAFL